MRYFYDFEFDEDGRVINPISLGIVAEDGRELYLVNSTYFRQWNAGIVQPNRWVKDNVLNKISMQDRAEWGIAIKEFSWIVLNFISKGGTIQSRNDVELWGSYSAYDHVCLAQLWGPMINLPEPIPMFTSDDQTIRGLQQPPTRPADLPEHHALADAKFQKLQWEKWTKG